MVTLTRSEAKTAFNHVLDHVLGRDDSSFLKSSLAHEGIDDIFDFITLTDDVIDSLVYKDTNDSGTFLPLRKGDKMLVKCFLAYNQHLHTQGNDFEFGTLLQADFDSFRISPLSKVTSPVTVTPTATPSSGIASSTSNVPTIPPYMTSVALFRRAIKKDPSLFPTLKDDRFHDTWHRSFNTQAMAQDISDVLDENYIPTSADDIALFAEKQKYLYAVLETKVLTDRGKAIIRDHEHDFDAQKVYQRIKKYHLSSTKADMESSVILSYITSTRLGEGTWNGTSESFIINWQNQVRLYEKHVPPHDYFSDGQKRTMLQNAVHGIDELRQVKNTADHLATSSGSKVTYDEYISLLLSAAAAYDAKFKPQKTKRQVFFHATEENHDVMEDIEPYDIDSPVSCIQAYASNFRPKPPHPKAMTSTSTVKMSSDKWFSLDDKSKATWDRLDDKAKSIILGYTPIESSSRASSSSTFSSNRSPFGKPPFGGKPPFKPQAHLHEISAYDFLLANMHDLDSQHVNTEPSEDLDDNHPVVDSIDTRLINAAKSNNKGMVPPGDIRRVMSKSSTRFANSAHLQYHVSFHKASSGHSLSLIDRGANGGVAGDDVRILFRTNRTVDIKGIDNHHVNNIGIGTVGGVVTTQHGPVIAIMHQYALLGKGASIHSPCQLEWYKNDVNDKSIHVPGGKQQIKTLDGYTIPLIVKDRLTRLDIRPHTDREFDTLPHVFLTSELDWDPTVLDHAFDNESQWIEPDGHTDLHPNPLFDEFGNYRHRVSVQYLSYFTRQDGKLPEDLIDQCVLHSHQSSPRPNVMEIHELECLDNDQATYDNIECLDKAKAHYDKSSVLPPSTRGPTTIHKKDPDFSLLRPFFGWLSPDIIRKTFQHTTQYARLPTGTTLKRAFRSPNPALNVTRRNEAVACDIVYADVPAIDDGSDTAVIFVGTDTQVTDIYGIKSDKQFVNTLEDNITQRGAPHKLISDSAQVIIGHKVQDILRTL